MWPEGLPCQSPAFSYVTADREIPVLTHVALAWPLEHSELVATCKPDAIDFPVGKHMTMLHLLLELCGILVEALGRVPQSEEAIIRRPI